jgi:hypothetical protein
MVRIAIVLVVALAACRSSAMETSPVDVGSRRELFVDRHVIERLEGAQLLLHHPQPANMVLKFDRPWEGPFCGYVTVIKDGAKYRMYYRGLPDLKDDSDAECTCYAESADGARGTRPNLGLYEISGTRENNVVLYGQTPASHNFSPFLDANPKAVASEPFKAVCGSAVSGLMGYVSADGLHWRKVRAEPLLRAGAFDSQNVAFWSEQENCYVCYFRTWTETGPSGTQFAGKRTISRATSPDFLTWTKPATMDFGPGAAEELYTNQTEPYFRAPQIYVSLPMRFHGNRSAFTDAIFAGVATGVHPAYMRSARTECTDGVFMTSRGGDHYDRTFREAFFRPGLDLKNWVSRSVLSARGVVPTGPGEMSVYYGQHDGQKTAHLLRCTLRTDGFVSVNAPYSGGEMLTKPLVFAGNELELNYSTSAAGSIRIEIQDAAGKPISGFTLGECPEIIGDQIERVVTWKAGADVRKLAKQPIRLRFVMKDADLYSLRFRAR